MITKRFDIRNPFPGGGDVYDYAALESLDEFKELVKDSTIIAIVSLDGKKTGIAYGTETLRAIAARVIPQQQIKPIVFAVDFSPAADVPLEHLLAAVQVVKGFHEWRER